MSDSKEIRTMRAMEWERVKGGLCAILHSFWASSEKSRFERCETAFKGFIEKVEDEGLVE